MAEARPEPAPWELRLRTDPHGPVLLVLDPDPVVDACRGTAADEVRRLAFVAEDDHRSGPVRAPYDATGSVR